MTLVLDTSILIALERKDKETLSKLETITEKYKSPPSITFINLFEILLGIKLRQPRRYKEAIEFLERFDVLNTTDETAKILAEIKIKYDKKGIILPLADLIIVSLVIENKMILITKDRDFEKIEELKKEII